MLLANCPLSSGITRDCRDGSPGLVEVIVTEKENNTIAIVSASGSITNTVSFLATGKKFWSYEFEYGKANEQEVVTVNRNGTVSVAQTLTIYIAKKQADVAHQLMLLSKRDTLWALKDKNSLYRLLGAEFGMRLSTNTAAGGATGNDDSGYTLVLVAEERTLAPEMTAALYALLKLPA